MGDYTKEELEQMTNAELRELGGEGSNKTALIASILGKPEDDAKAEPADAKPEDDAKAEPADDKTVDAKPEAAKDFAEMGKALENIKTLLEKHHGNPPAKPTHARVGMVAHNIKSAFEHIRFILQDIG